MNAAKWSLHPQLAADTTLLGRFELSLLLLSNDANYPWFILVPQRTGIREIHELTEADQTRLLRESSQLGRALMTAFGGTKLNVAALGNMVPQLHVHHIVRYEHDPAWPAPVWGKVAAKAYEVRQRAERIAALLAEIGPGFTAMP
jgi:diadenosine tetraphosphate (Ap4A) HIT family hydrolase